MRELWERSDMRPGWRVWIATRRGVMSETGVRLFACWCVRQVWHLMKDQRSRNAVDVAERFASGQATKDELDAARAAAASSASSAAAYASSADAADASYAAAAAASSYAASADAAYASYAAAADASYAAAAAASSYAADATYAMRSLQSARLIELGNPFKDEQ